MIDARTETTTDRGAARRADVDEAGAIELAARTFRELCELRAATTRGEVQCDDGGRATP